MSFLSETDAGDVVVTPVLSRHLPGGTDASSKHSSVRIVSVAAEFLTSHHLSNASQKVYRVRPIDWCLVTYSAVKVRAYIQVFRELCK
jgi:hypothetical protein